MEDYGAAFNLKRKSDTAHAVKHTTTGSMAWSKKDSLPNGKKTKGRVKIKMEFIDNKLRRYTTFSKRKTGIMKKAYELSTLTGTQVMLLVASETGHVYTFATKKLQPMITSEAGKALIQTCLNSPDEGDYEGKDGDQRMSAAGYEETDLSYAVDDKEELDEYEMKYCDEDGDWEERVGPTSDEECTLTESNDDAAPTNLSLNSSRRTPVDGWHKTIHNPRPSAQSGQSRPQTTMTMTSPLPLVMRTDAQQPATTNSTTVDSVMGGDENSEGSDSNSPTSSKTNSQLLPTTDASTLRTVFISAAPSATCSSQLPGASSNNVLNPPPSLPPEVLAQLGYTNLLAQASSSRLTNGVHRPLLIDRRGQQLEQPGAAVSGAGYVGHRISHLLPREPVPHVSLIKLEPAPENLSVHRKT